MLSQLFYLMTKKFLMAGKKVWGGFLWLLISLQSHIPICPESWRWIGSLADALSPSASSRASADESLPGNPSAPEVDSSSRWPWSRPGWTTSSRAALRTTWPPTWRCRSSRRRRLTWTSGTRWLPALSTEREFSRRASCRRRRRLRLRSRGRGRSRRFCRLIENWPEMRKNELKLKTD